MVRESNQKILDRLHDLRAKDAPTHGGRLLSYVYDSGLAELDELAAAAANMALPVNGLDPTAFSSVPAMEKDLISFAKSMFHAKPSLSSKSIEGTITSGGTESCMLAVKTARDYWRSKNPSHSESVTPRIVAPRTVHAAFQKAAHYFGLIFDAVPVSSEGVVNAADMISRLDTDVAIVVVSAPSYPTAQLDPIADVAAAAKKLGISCHVDACIGGFVLPWWGGLPPWDFRVPGVTSISADLHKFGYAPKGASILLQKGKTRHRKQFFATTKWPGYPVVNPTMLGSRSATGLAAAWAIVQKLQHSGYADLTNKTKTATLMILEKVKNIEGMSVLGTPAGPLLALSADNSLPKEKQVDPHHFADQMSALGFFVQHQPGLLQEDGTQIPHSVHLTITPVTLINIQPLLEAIEEAATQVRGKPRANPKVELTALKMLGLLENDATLSVNKAGTLLRIMGMGGSGSSLPKKMAPLMRIIEELPPSVAETLLIEVLARVSQP